MAQAIHDLSPRHQRPMIRVSCAAIPTSLIESELFGREKGAYTGALSRQIGRFEAANQSTLFLDEIGDLPMEVQVKLLRVLQERVIERLGSTQPVKVDVRIIAATNRNLEDAVRDKTFREDLFYRLNVFPVVVPPLRERVEDIPALVWSFIDEFSRSFGKTIESISKDSLRELQRYPWPGNVRELRNVIERAVIMATGRQLVVGGPAARRTADAADRHDAEPSSKSSTSAPCSRAPAGASADPAARRSVWASSRQRSRAGWPGSASRARKPAERAHAVAPADRPPARDNGTRARMVAPAPGRDSMDSSPLTRLSLSLMLISPSPGPVIAASGSKPIPSSTTSSRIASPRVAQRDRDMTRACVLHRVVHGFL